MGSRRYYLLTLEVWHEVRRLKLETFGFGILTIVGAKYPSVRQVPGLDSQLFEPNLEAELYYLRNRVLSVQQFGKASRW